MSKMILTLLAALFLVACASTHPGTSGQSQAPQPKIPLKLSAQNIDEEESDAFQLIEVTLENTSDRWVKISKVQYLIQDPDTSKLSVVLGQDLSDWAQASANKRKVEMHNRQMVQAGLVGLGAVAMASSGKNSDMGVAGALMTTGTYGWVLSDAIRADLRNAEGVKQVPANHLYHPASVPGKMFLRRWILLNKPSDSVVKVMRIEIETIEGEKETYAFNF